MLRLDYSNITLLFMLKLRSVKFHKMIEMVPIIMADTKKSE